MPDNVLGEWERIIRQVVSNNLKGSTNSFELSFSQEAKHLLISWKNETNNRIYSETVKALCGKIETYLIRFCLIIQIMCGVCGKFEMNEIDIGNAERAILLTEYIFKDKDNITDGI